MVRPQLAGAVLGLLKIANLRCSFTGSLSQVKQIMTAEIVAVLSFPCFILVANFGCRGAPFREVTPSSRRTGNHPLTKSLACPCAL
jgi:hypothetical protein